MAHTVSAKKFGYQELCIQVTDNFSYIATQALVYRIWSLRMLVWAWQGYGRPFSRRSSNLFDPDGSLKLTARSLTILSLNSIRRRRIAISEVVWVLGSCPSSTSPSGCTVTGRPLTPFPWDTAVWKETEKIDTKDILQRLVLSIQKGERAYEKNISILKKDAHPLKMQNIFPHIPVFDLWLGD